MASRPIPFKNLNPRITPKKTKKKHQQDAKANMVFLFTFSLIYLMGIVFSYFDGSKLFLVFLTSYLITLVSLVFLFRYRSKHGIARRLFYFGIFVPLAIFITSITFAYGTTDGRAIMVVFIVAIYGLIGALGLYQSIKKMQKEQTDENTLSGIEPEQINRRDVLRNTGHLKAVWSQGIKSGYELEKERIEGITKIGPLTFYFSLGTMFSFFCIFYFKEGILVEIMWYVSFILLLFTVILAIVWIHMKRNSKEPTFATNVVLNISEVKTAVKGMQLALTEYGYRYRVTRKKQPWGSAWLDPALDYHIDGGIRLELRCMKMGGGISGWIYMYYTSGNANIAKKLQEDLDNYLTDADVLMKREYLSD